MICHTYLRAGSRLLQANDLSSVGRAQPLDFFERYIANPRRYGNSVMPRFGDLGSRQNLRDVAAFLAASKGPR